MIPVLFKEDEQVFSHNGIGALYESLSCDVIEEENGAFTMELEYPVDGELFSEIKDFRIIQAKPNDIDDPHNFRIYEIVKSIDELTVYVRANTRTNDLGNNLITNYVGKDVTPQQAMNGMKTSLIEPTNFDLISDIQTKSNVEWTRVNPLNAIVGTRGSLVDIWGGEIKRTNTAIYLYSRRGRDNVVTIRPGKNIEGLNMTVSTAGLITKILPTFTYRPVDVPKYQMVTRSDGSKEKQRVPASGGTTIRDDITVLGDVVSSQYVDNYPTNYWTSVDYDDDDELKDKVDNYIDARLSAAEDSPTIINMSGFENDLKNFVKTELDKKAKQYFTHRNPGVDKPTVRISVDMLQLSDSPDWEEFKNLEQIGLTDTLDVWVEKYDIDVEVRVTSLTYDSMAERVVSFNAGSDRAPRQSAIEKKYDDLTRATNDYITSFKNGVQNVMRNTADGLNRKFEGYTEPPAELSSEGDIWFKELGEGKVEIWIHDGVYWQPLMTEDFVEQVVRDIAATQDELEEAKQQAIADSEQALADAKAHAEAEDARIRGELELEVGGAIEIAEEAKQDAIDRANQALVDAKAYSDAEIALIETHFDDIIEGVESDVADAKQTADDSMFKINNDIADKFTSLDAELLDIEAVSNAAKTNAQTAINHSLDALEDAGTALTNAQTALTEAQKKVNTIDFDNIVNDIETGVQEAMDEAELATNTLRDSTGQLIKSQDLKVDIDGITSSLTSYAKTTDLNGLATETFVTNKGYQTAAQVSSALGAYAKTTDLNGLVSQTWVENKGYATASEVSSELSSYAKSSDLTGLATETYVTTRGYQTASQISTTLSAYEKTSSLNTKLAGKANVGDIPSLTGYAKESWVENKSYATAASVTTSLKAYEKITDVNAKLADKADIDDIPDITGLASETWVENKSYATAASVTTQLSSYAKTSQLTGLATETFVTNKGYQTAAQVATTLSSYAKTSQLTGLATETFVTSKGYQTASQVSTTLASYAKTTDLSGLATETFVTSRGYQTASQITTTLAAYAKTSQLSGLATETFVTNKGYQTASQVSTTLSSYVKTSTLSGYATVATVNAIKSTADTNKATISTNTGKISTIEQNVSGLQTTVAGKASQTQVTQIENGFNVLSKEVVKNLYPGTWSSTGSNLTVSYPSGILRVVQKVNYSAQNDSINRIWGPGFSTPQGSSVSISGEVRMTSGASGSMTFTQTHTGTNKGFKVPTTTAWTYFGGTYTALNNNAFSLFFHNIGTYEIRNLTMTFGGGASEGQLSVLNDNINLRVSKNDVINQINISSEGILINGSKTHITGTTKIDTGVIKTAHIGSLDAAKITTGTIAAARLNAGAIVTAGLAANVIKSTHIETSTATVDKIFATDAMVNRLTAKTAFISSVQAVNISAARITSGTIAAARLNASAIVTAGLTANVIKSTHIDGNTALFDKLFSTTSATSRLAAQTAWIKNANIANAEINGAKIANATIASAKIVSLDASKISAGTLSGFTITSPFDYAYDGAIRNKGSMTMSTGQITLNGTFTHSHGSTYMYIRADRIYAENLLSNRSVRSSFSLDGDGVTVHKLGSTAHFRQDGVHFTDGGNASIKYYDANARIEVGSYNGVSLGANFTGTFFNRLAVGGGADNVDPFVDIYTKLNMRNNYIDNVTKMHLRTPAAPLSGSVLENTTDNWLEMAGRWGTRVGHRSENNATFYTRAEFTTTDIKFYANLNMQTRTIINQSDERLKRDIVYDEVDSLNAIKNWRMAGFNWRDPEATTERQFGVIAQSTPEIASMGENGYLNVNSSKQLQMVTHALQQLETRDGNAIKANEEKIHQLQQELSKANRRIEELEGAM